MPDPKKYHLRVTAGHSYDPSSHVQVAVNNSTATKIDSGQLTATLSVRIQNYRGLPAGSPSTCAYFDTPPHSTHKDLYSIGFNFVLKEDIAGDELVFGNDFERPIRDNLPMGFGAALKFVKWSLDPGLDGDVYADKPYMYGPLLSSINQFRIGEQGKQTVQEDENGVLREGADGDGEKVRSELEIPEKGGQRMKFFLQETHKKSFKFEKGRAYGCDFFNPYLDFNDLSLKLPVITLPLMRFWDGQPLRYVLKKRSKDGKTDELLMCVVFTLVSAEEAEKESEQGASKASGAAEKQSKSGGEKGGYVDEGVD